MAGIGTRFPIRVVSRRTAQDSRERFRISLERAPQDVNGLQRADAAADNYRLEGDTLTMDAFKAALEDVSDCHLMGVYRVLTNDCSSLRTISALERARAQGQRTLCRIL